MLFSATLEPRLFGACCAVALSLAGCGSEPDAATPANGEPPPGAADASTPDAATPDSGKADGGVEPPKGSGPPGVWAVGTHGAIVHFDGKQWATDKSNTTHGLYGVWGSSGNDVWAVGLSGTIVHFDGAAWSVVPSGTTVTLRSVWGTGPKDVWFGGGATDATILHYDGTHVTSVSTASIDSPYQKSVDHLWGSSAVDIWGVCVSGILCPLGRKVVAHGSGVEVRRDPERPLGHRRE